MKTIIPNDEFAEYNVPLKEHHFASQGEAVGYFLCLILNCASRGSLSLEQISAFQVEMKGLVSCGRSPQEVWGRGTEILTALRGEIKDSTTETHFSTDIKVEKNGNLSGTLSWRGQWTTGRKVCISFRGGEAVGLYKLGLRLQDDRGYYEVIRHSTLLNLPLRAGKNILE